ncbi:MAG: rhodanese-like domain-containing protein [Desulfomonilia bacterium]|nr:rhodanese-like domain-containing protein [Desulfomonilia bacterium]
MTVMDLPTVKRAFWQATAIVVFSAALALLVNTMHPRGIPLIQDWSIDALMIDEQGLRMDIPLDEAIQAFRQGDVVFLDARTPREYAQGHIKGARLLPFDEVEEYVIEATQDLSVETLIVTYCDGEACMLSHDLALYLRGFGFEHVRVLVNGWFLWLEQGMPVEKADGISGEGEES